MSKASLCRPLHTLAFISMGIWAGCGEDEPAGATAKATLAATSTASTTTGTVAFAVKGAEVEMTVNIQGASPGEHAVHLHQNGNCDSTTDATTGMAVPGGGAGGHWNPESMKHGKFGEGAHHLGDVGNLTVGADGKGSLTFKTNRWTIGTAAMSDIVGKSVIVHAMKDDLMTDPTGNAGGRVACGVITKTP